MLVDEPKINDDPSYTRLEQGVYLAPDGEFWPKHLEENDFEEYPELPGLCDAYGVCDNLDQVKWRCPTIVGSGSRKFIIILREIRKSDQPAQGGWRWHKWGEYIGAHYITSEYLYDEKVVDRVLVFHVYEQKTQRHCEV